MLQQLYYRQELSQVRQAIRQACEECGCTAAIQVQSLDIDPNALLITMEAPDDVLLRNAVTIALAGYDLAWHEEMVEDGLLTFSLDIGYWRIMRELAQMKKARPRLSWWRRLSNAFRPTVKAGPEPKEEEAMEEGWD